MSEKMYPYSVIFDEEKTYLNGAGYIDESSIITLSEIEIKQNEPNNEEVVDKNDWGGGFRFKERLSNGYYDKFPRIMLGRFLGGFTSYDRSYFLFEDENGAKIEFEDGGRNFENYTSDNEKIGGLFTYVWELKNNKPYIDRIFSRSNKSFEYETHELIRDGSYMHGTTVYDATGNENFYKNTDNLCAISPGLVERIKTVSSPNATTLKISSKSKTNLYGETWNIKSNSDTVILNIEVETINNMTITKKIKLHFKDK